MNIPREALQIVLDIIKNPAGGEGCRLHSYWDASGKKWTIGWGCTGPGINSKTVWTQPQADNALLDRLNAVWAALSKVSPCLLTASPQRQAAMIDLIYNCGLTDYMTSKLREYVDSLLWDRAADQILKWNKSGGVVKLGLVKRRKIESDLLRIDHVDIT